MKSLSSGRDTKCPKCKGAGEVLVRNFSRMRMPELSGVRELAATDLVQEMARIVECALCCGTGLVELDESWEHA